MQNTSKVLQGQSFLDKTLELTGTIESIVMMAVLNNKSITDTLSINEEITTTGIIKSTVATNLFRTKPATAISLNTLQYDTVSGLTGIEYWGIEIDFEVQ